MTRGLTFLGILLIASTLGKEIIPAFKPFEAKWTSPNLFVVENLASMRLRVYDRPCSFSEKCKNVLLFDTLMVVGKDEPKKRSRLGAYKIKSWAKFYVDGDKEFLPWNKPPIPPPGSSRSQWGKQGAFGWYAMILEPDAFGQWTHGTIGWGQDQMIFIDPEASNGKKIRLKSKGCTRLSNESIAILRNYLPAGTPVFKIYAKESLKDEFLFRYIHRPFIHSWKYVLAKGKDVHPFPLERFNLEDKDVYEKGETTYSSQPKAFPVRQRIEWVEGELNGNPYEIPSEDLKGEFLVDEGVLKDYTPPKKIPKNLESFPDFFVL